MRSHVRMVGLLCAALLGLALAGCGRQADGWSNGQPPQSLSNSDVPPLWIAAAGGAGVVYLVDPFGSPEKYFKRISLDIDCYITAVAKVGDEILLGAGRSRRELDSPGGIYSVDIATGSTKLLVEAAVYEGGIDSLYTVDNRRILVISYRGNTMVGYSTVIDMSSKKIVARRELPQSQGMSRWAHVGNGVLCSLAEDGRFVTVDTIAGKIEYTTTRFNRIARSDIENVIVARTENKWSEWKRDPVDGSLARKQSFGNGDGYVVSAFETSNAETVLITGFEIPTMSIWCIGGNELVINKLYHIYNAIDYP